MVTSSTFRLILIRINSNGEQAFGTTYEQTLTDRCQSRFTALSGLIGKVPSNPLWAELLAARQRAARAAKAALLAVPNNEPAAASGSD